MHGSYDKKFGVEYIRSDFKIVKTDLAHAALDIGQQELNGV
jgi:hypothetical protein